jgi:hypothetical protein
MAKARLPEWKLEVIGKNLRHLDPRAGEHQIEHGRIMRVCAFFRIIIK